MKKYKERVEIGCYTKMSQMKGINSYEEYIKEAIKRKWDAIGITDLNSVQSFYDIENYIEKEKIEKIENLKIIYGIKTKFIYNEKNSKNKIYDIVILIKEQAGLKNLYNILSKALTNVDYSNPVVAKSELDKYREGLLYGASAGFGGEIYQSILKSEKDTNEKAKYYDFLEVEPLYNAKEEVYLTNDTSVQVIDKTEDMQRINKEIIKIGKKNNILVIAASNPLFINKEDKICNEIIKYSQSIKNIKYDNERFLHTTKEMLAEFKYIKDKDTIYDIVIKNTHILADKCNYIKIKQTQSHFPKIKDGKNIIKEKCYKKANEIYKGKLPKKIKERLELELNSIIENNFEFPYLLAADIVKKSEELGYITFNRGSVGCSFVAYLLGITDYNPIEYNLPFEPFAGINYDKEPDIDINVSEEIKDEIFKAIKEEYGKNRVVYCGTINTMSDYCSRKTIKEYLNNFEIPVDNDKLEELASKISGVKKETHIHSGGIFILPKTQEITDFTPIEIVNKTKEIKTHFDYHDILENVDSLYKCDVLAHDTLKLLHGLHKATGINPKSIDLKDNKTLDLLLHAKNTKKIFEFETDFNINLIKKIKPQNFNDLVCILCLGHGTNTWFNNAEYLITEGTDVSEVVSNREDIINYLMKKGINKKYAFEIMRFVQKGMAKKAIEGYRTNNEETIKNYSKKWEEYTKIMEEHNIEEWYIKSCEKISYLFPKAHAIEYTINAFRIAWYTVHYPKEFNKTYKKLSNSIKTNL